MGSHWFNVSCTTLRIVGAELLSTSPDISKTSIVKNSKWHLTLFSKLRIIKEWKTILFFCLRLLKLVNTDLWGKNNLWQRGIVPKKSFSGGLNKASDFSINIFLLNFLNNLLQECTIFFAGYYFFGGVSRLCSYKILIQLFFTSRYSIISVFFLYF